MSLPPEFLCIGETMVLIHPVSAVPLADAESFHLDIGGAESNVALYLNALGHTTSWLSRVGDDPLGERLLRNIEGHGVDVSNVVVDPDAQTAVYFKDPHPSGTRVFYYRRGSAASKLSPTDLDRVSFEGVKVVHISGITAGLSDSCALMLERVIDETHDHGGLVSFDVNYRPGVWNVEDAAPRLAHYARCADIVLVGRDEAQTLWNTSTPRSIADHLQVNGALVVKDGDVGATEFLNGKETFVPALNVEVVELVGAGDAFAAGYLSSWSRGEPAQKKLEAGHFVASRALASLSDFNPVAKQELKQQ